MKIDFFFIDMGKFKKCSKKFSLGNFRGPLELYLIVKMDLMLDF